MTFVRNCDVEMIDFEGFIIEQFINNLINMIYKYFSNEVQKDGRLE